MSFANIVTTIKAEEIRSAKRPPKKANCFDNGTAKDRMASAAKPIAEPKPDDEWKWRKL